MKKSYPVENEVVLVVDSQHTNLIFETWNKSEMEVEAYVETKGLSEEEIASALEAWKVSIRGGKANMEIDSKRENAWSASITIPGGDSLGKITQDFIGPLMNNLVGPMLESFSNNPLPPELMEGVGSLEFDHEAYKRDGEKYMEQWEKELESKFGKDVEIAMEAWSKNFEDDAKEWGAKMEVEMEAWGEDFGKDMEKWAEKFGKEMEVWGEQFGKDMEEWAENAENMEGKDLDKHFRSLPGTGAGKAKRTMVIKIPEDAKLKLKVRYGEVKLPKRTSNLKANLSHSKLIANIIDGGETEIEASYTPVHVQEWNYGVLSTNYVKDCSIEKAKSLKLTSVSSDVQIGEIQETGIISGTFGDLNITNLASDFKTLDISLENSELSLKLPNSALNFLYTGSQSTIAYPSTIKGEPVKSYDSETINGYQKSRNSDGLVTIKAKYSDVDIK